MALFKKILKTLVISFISLSLIIGTYLYLNQDKILNIAIETLNSHLTAEVSVESISLSPFSNWPSVSVVLDQVIIDSSIEFQSDLLEAEQVTITFDIFQLIKKQIDFKSLIVKNAKVNLEVSKYGERNFEIFHESDSSGTDQSLKFESMTLISSDLSYTNYSQKKANKIKTAILELNASFALEQTEISGVLDSDFVLHELTMGKLNYLKRPRIKADLEFNLRQLDSILAFHKGKLKTEQMNVDNLEGQISLLNDLPFQLTTTLNKVQLEDLEEILPAGTLTRVTPYRPSGEMKGSLQLSGTLRNFIKSDFELSFSSDNLALYYPKYDLQFNKHVSEGLIIGKGGFNVNNINIHTLQSAGLLDGHDVKLIINNLQGDLSNYKMEISGISEAKSFNKIFKNDKVGVEKATIAYSVNLQKSPGEFLWDGELSVEDGKIDLNSQNLLLEDLSGEFIFNNDELAIQDVNLRIKESDLSLSGHILNPTQIFKAKPEGYTISGEIKSNYLDINHLLQLTQTSDEEGSASQPRDYTINPSLFLDLNLDLGYVKYKKFKGNSVAGRLQISDQLLSGENIKLESLGGNVSGSFIADTKPNFIGCYTNAQVTNLAVDSIFYIFNNFDQDFIEFQHLDGLITASAETSFFLTKGLNPIFKTVESNINASVTDGRLKNFEPMQRLSKFVDEDQLANMSFEELTNRITIKDSQVNIPNMSIRSNVSNIELSGWHTFDQKIDYHLKVPLRKVYKKDKDESFGEIIENEETITNLFIKITGTTDNYKVSYDQKRSLENMSKQIKAEGKELMEAIKTKGANLNKKATIKLQEGDFFDFEEDTLATDSIN